MTCVPGSRNRRLRIPPSYVYKPLNVSILRAMTFGRSLLERSGPKSRHLRSHATHPGVRDAQRVMSGSAEYSSYSPLEYF